MGQSTLTRLAVLHIRYDVAVDVNGIVDMFTLQQWTSQHPRKMSMTDILQDAEWGTKEPPWILTRGDVVYNSIK